ncbi:ABC transporter permease, partial [Acinetobacter baumannii]
SRPPAASAPSSRMAGGLRLLREASRMALVSMAAHRMRAFLTMLGIIIGIAAVSTVVALGNATQRKVLADISSLGTNTIEVFPGK